MPDWLDILDSLEIPEGAVAGLSTADKAIIEGRLLQLAPEDRPLFFRGQHSDVLKRLRTLLPAVSSVQEDFYAAFQEKLKLCHITSPDAKTMKRLLLHFSTQMQAMSLPSVDPDIASTFYRKVKDLPGTETCMNIAEQSRISINGPWLPEHPHLLTAVDLDNGSLLAFKLLPPVSTHQKDAAQSEKRALKLLKLDKTPVADALVPTQLHVVKVSLEHARALELEAGSYDALRMPWYTASLHHLPQLSDELLLRGGQRLQQALRAMHEVNLLHTDVKAANVFVDSSGAWFLGDFGASNMFEDRIKYCTEAMYPGTIKFQPAAPKHDWGLLVVLLAIEMDKKNWTQLCGNTKPQKIVLDLVLQKCCTEHLGLQALFDELIVAAGWGEGKTQV